MTTKTPQAGDDLGAFFVGIHIHFSVSIHTFPCENDAKRAHIIPYISTNTPEPE